MKKSIIYVLTGIIIVIVTALISGLFIKKETKPNKMSTIKVSDTTLTSWTYKDIKNTCT